MVLLCLLLFIQKHFRLDQAEFRDRLGLRLEVGLDWLGFWYRLQWALRFGLSSKEYKFGLRVQDDGRGQVYGGFGDRFGV